jgi:hypothetical protein
VQDCGGGYPTGTLFAVGPCAALQPYSFADYQSSVGYPNTIDLSNYFASTIAFRNASSFTTLQSSIQTTYQQTKQYVSTIPLTHWISTGATSTITTYPFTYFSTFDRSISTVTSNVISTQSYSFLSTGVFGTYDSNIYPNCTGYTYISTFPILQSTFTSTTTTQFTSSYILNYRDTISSVDAQAYPFDFQSTTDLNASYPLEMQTSNLWLGTELQSLIDSKQYNVFVEYQYNIYVSTNTDRFTWLSTTGVFGSPGTTLGVNGYTGRTTATRAAEKQYIEVYTKQMFSPQPAGQETQLAATNCNFAIHLSLTSSPFIMAPGSAVYADVFVPGENNFTFTLVPITSNSV